MMVTTMRVHEQALSSNAAVSAVRFILYSSLPTIDPTMLVTNTNPLAATIALELK
jgi:hypothetical protein